MTKKGSQNELPVEQMSTDWRFLALGIFFALLSLVKEWSILGVTLNGGTTVAALAAIFLLWPLLRHFALYGGRAEFFGIKLERLEKKSEEEYGLRIEDLRQDIEEIERTLKSASLPIQRDAGSSVSALTEQNFNAAIVAYKLNRATSKWRERVETDKALVHEFISSYPLF